MHKKLITACLAIAAFAAFVVAPAASASPVLTEITKIDDGGGVITEVSDTLSPGTSIKGTNTGNTLFTIEKDKTAVECTHAEFRGNVTVNNGAQIKGEIPVGGSSFSGTGANGDCTSPLGDIAPTVTSKLCLETTLGTDNVKITGCGANIKFSLKVTGLTTCNYKAAEVTGTFKTGADATVNLSEQRATLESGLFCPGEGWLDMDFDLTTTDGTTLLVS